MNMPGRSQTVYTQITTRGEPSSWSVAGAAPGNSLIVHSACLVTPGSEEYGE